MVSVASLIFPRSAFLSQPHLQEIINHNWGEFTKVRLQWELLTFCTTHQVPLAVVWKSAWLLLILMSSIKHLYCTLWEFDFQYFMQGNVPLRFYLGLEHKSAREKGCYRERTMNGLTSLQTPIVQIRLLQHSHTKLCLHNFDLKLCCFVFSHWWLCSALRLCTLTPRTCLIWWTARLGKQAIIWKSDWPSESIERRCGMFCEPRLSHACSRQQLQGVVVALFHVCRFPAES